MHHRHTHNLRRGGHSRLASPRVDHTAVHVYCHDPEQPNYLDFPAPLPHPHFNAKSLLFDTQSEVHQLWGASVVFGLYEQWVNCAPGYTTDSVITCQPGNSFGCSSGGCLIFGTCQPVGTQAIAFDSKTSSSKGDRACTGTRPAALASGSRNSSAAIAASCHSGMSTHGTSVPVERFQWQAIPLLLHER